MSPEPATQQTRRATRCRTHALRKEMPRAALFLLFLLVMTKCLAVNALADTKNATNAAAAANTTDTEFSTCDLSPMRAVPPANPLATITKCTPGIIILGFYNDYFCKLENVAALRRLTGLKVGFYMGNKPFPQWDATLDVTAGGVRFKVSTSGSTETRPLVITAIIKNKITVVTNAIELLFFDKAKTTAKLEGNSLYGLTAAITTNFPQSSSRTPLYRMIPWNVHCQAECTTTSCYDVSSSKALPPPGRYTLCVTTSVWEGQHVWWGQNSLDVRSLLSTSQYLVNGANNTVKLVDAATGAEVSRSLFASAYLARCPVAGCPTVQPVNLGSGKEDPVMAASVCNTNQRVDLVEGKVLVAESGVYAACFVDKEGKVTPTALSLRVVPAPFAVNATIMSNTTAVVSLKGGDMGQRKERYEVRVLREGASCTNTNDLETKGITTVLSGTPNSPFVNVTVSGNVNITKVKFCLVASNVTLWGRRHMTVFGVADLPEDVPEEEEEQKAKKSPVIWIIVGSVVGFIVLCAIIAAICICKRRNRKAADDKTNDPRKQPYGNREVLLHPADTGEISGNVPAAGTEWSANASFSTNNPTADSTGAPTAAVGV